MKGIWTKFKEGLFTRSQFLTGMTLSFILVSTFVYAFNQLSLNIFTAGTTISAADVNANFEYVNERIEALAEYSQGFSVETSSALAISSVARTTPQLFSDGSSVGSIPGPIYPLVGTFFDTYPSQVSTLTAANYIADQYYEVQQDGFYMLHFSAKPSSYQSMDAYGVIYWKSPSLTAIDSIASYNYGYTSVSSGASVSHYLRSGDKVFFNVNVSSGGATMNFEPGIRFTVKKL